MKYILILFTSVFALAAIKVFLVKVSFTISIVFILGVATLVAVIIKSQKNKLDE